MRLKCPECDKPLKADLDQLGLLLCEKCGGMFPDRTVIKRLDKAEMWINQLLDIMEMILPAFDGIPGGNINMAQLRTHRQIIRQNNEERQQEYSAHHLLGSDVNNLIEAFLTDVDMLIKTNYRRAPDTIETIRKIRQDIISQILPTCEELTVACGDHVVDISPNRHPISMIVTYIDISICGLDRHGEIVINVAM